MFARNGTLLLKCFNSYFFPTILMSVALSMSIVVDGVIVGNMLGQGALAAVNLGLPLMQGYAAIFVFFGMGGSILAAWHLGRHEQRQACAVFTIASLALAAISLFCAVAGILMLPWLAALLAGGTDLAQPLASYIAPLLWGAPLLILTPGLSYFARVDGQPGLASAILILANAVNLLCDPLFILWLDDIAGAGIATVTGYGAGLLLFGFYLASPKRSMRFAIQVPSLSGLCLAICRSGLPGGLSIGLQFLKFFFLNLLVLSVAGQSGMVAFSVCLACLSLASMFISGASQTMMPILGVLYGEADYTGMKIVFRRAFNTLMLCTLALIAVLMLFPHELLLIFGINGGDMPIGERAVRFYAPSLLGDSFAMLMIYYAQTIQCQKVAIAASILQNAALLLPAAWLLSSILGLDGVWLSFSFAGIGTAIAILAMSRHEAAHSDGKIAGLLMLPPHDASASCLDVSLRNTIENAVGLSAKTADFCRSQGVDAALAARAGIIVEEMAVNVVRYGGQKPGAAMLDARIRITEQELRICFRDAGIPFSPLDYMPPKSGPQTGGIPLIRALGGKMEYNFALGFNNSVVILPRNQHHMQH